jgi:hypothetical protein
MIKVKEAIEVIENALSFYAEEGISSDKKAQTQLDDSWNIVKQKINYGNGYDDTNSVAIIWCIDDVKSVRPDLTDDQCLDVLGRADSKHDATLGVTWETLECIADYLFPQEEDVANG